MPLTRDDIERLRPPDRRGAAGGRRRARLRPDDRRGRRRARAGSFYDLYENKDEAFAAASRLVGRASAGQRPTAKVRVAIAQAIELVGANPGRARLWLVDGARA